MTNSLKKKTVHGVVWSALERFSVQGILFILQILMARILTPDDYGVIAMLAIFIAISQSFIDSGFSNALVQKTDRNEKDYATVFYFNIVVGIFFYFVLFFASPFIADFYNTPILKPITKIIGLNLFFNSMCVVQQARLTINLDFKTQAKVSLISVVISGIIGLSMAYTGFGVWSLVAQTVLQTAIRMIAFWIIAKWYPKEKFSKDSFKRLFNFGSKLLASGLLETIYKNVYTIIIGKLFSGTTLGYYSRADQFAQFPSSNITGILQRVTYPVLSSIQNEDDRLRANYVKFLRLSAFIVFPLMLGLAAVAEPFIRIILTEKWLGVVILLQIICFAYMWYPVHAINLNLLQVKGRSDLFLRLEIIKKIMTTIMLCISVPLGIIAICIGKVVNSFLVLIINTYYTGKLINLGFLKQMKDLLPILINSLIMFAIIYISISFIANDWIKLLSGIIIGTTYYITTSFLFKSAELKEILSIIRNK